jgi:beta-lactamase class A
VAVYFRDLQDGPWFGINERMSFSPASLMKLPILIAYLKLEEQQPGMLTSRTLVWDDDEDWNGTQNLRPTQAIEHGKPYTVGELLYSMMAFSDNRAWHVLFKNIDYRFLQQILDELNVSYDPSRTEDFMTVRSYSSLLRVLYNASYLNKQHSEKALELLSHVDFRDGIVAGLAPGITFSGKFGERGLGLQGEIKQLHEFGIVYYPGNHYLLGVMTRGGDFARQAEVIRDVSRLVYTEVERQTREEKSRQQEKP